MRQLLATIDAGELREWMAFERMEPFGALQDDFRAGQIAATMANLHRADDAEPYTPGFFMPALQRAVDGYAEREIVRPAPGLTPDQQAALLDAVLFGRAPS